MTKIGCKLKGSQINCALYIQSIWHPVLLQLEKCWIKTDMGFKRMSAMMAMYLSINTFISFHTRQSCQLRIFRI